MGLPPTQYLTALTDSLCSGRLVSRRGVPPIDNIPNFGKIDARLYRSAQPDSAALAGLVRRGLKTIINLRMQGDVEPEEEAFARAHGIVYLHFPLPGLRAPTDAQIARLFALVDGSPGPVLPHCEHGADRTGTFVACYRILRQGWSAEEALAEADCYGMSNLQIGMRNYVQHFHDHFTVPHVRAPGERLADSALAG
jgi:uncharacterized protein (TIGR01244 family)